MDRDALIGAWRLHEFRLTDERGNVTRPWREGSTGLLMYTTDGYMSAMVASVDDPQEGPRHLAYCGPFDFEGDRVVHHIHLSSEADLVGRDQVRQVDYDGETLTLSSSPSLYGGAGTSAALLWRRVAEDR
jgi:hypothetical protein